MKKTIDPAVEEYRQQLNRWVEGMAVSENAAVYPDAGQRYGPSDVDLFTMGNLDKRCEVLEFQMAFLKPVFDNLEELIVEHAATQPLAAYETGTVTGLNFLRWLEEEVELTPEQRDYIACRRGRYEVEEAARADRLAHLRFQERWSVAEHLVKRLGRQPGPRVLLNPMRALARFETTVFLEGQGEPPVDVVFYAVRSDIHTAVLEGNVPALLAALDSRDGLTVDEWAARADGASRDELIALARSLAGMGLVAFC